MPRAFLASIALVGALALAPAPAAGQPAQGQPAAAGPVRLLVGYAAGGAPDRLARVLAEALRGPLGRPVEVENRPGRSSATAAEAVARAAPDGATLLFATSSLATIRHMVRDFAIDPRTDLTPISQFVAFSPMVLVAPDHPARDLRGLAEALRARPDARCAVPDAGSFTHLAGVLLLRALGVACEVVHREEPAPAIADLRAGGVQLFVTPAAVGLRAAREGEARALAVLSPRRLDAAPEVPAAAETLPGFAAEAWFALVGPRGLPEPIVARLERAAVEAARDPAVAARLRALGAEPVGSTGAELAARLRQDDARLGEAARAAGLAAR